MRIEVKGAEATLRAFAGLGARVRQRIVRDSLRRSYGPSVQSIKQMASASVDTGTLKKSIGTKESNRPARALAVIGPRRRMGRIIVAGKRGRRKIASRAYERAIAALPPGQSYEFRNPVKYSHLVEFGHNIVRGGRVVGRVAARPFVEPGFAFTKYAALERFKKEFERRTLAAAKP